MHLAPTPDDLTAATAILRGGLRPRHTFCQAAARLLRADVAGLWEVRDGELRLTASSGDTTRVAPGMSPGSASAVGRAAAEARRFFVNDTAGDPVHREMVAALGLRSVLAEPVRIGPDGMGAIALGWRDHVAELDPLFSGFVSLMAVQASLGIERADLAERLERQSLTDPLTDLPNRRGLARELDREMARAARRGSPLGFALMDLDNFKAYNDTHGHGAGDRLLTRAARAWRTEIRAQDVLARYGGEEFVILLPDCGVGPLTPLQVVERVRQATPDGQTASVGLAIWDGREPPHRLAERADSALYAAKDRGRDRALAA